MATNPDPNSVANSTTTKLGVAKLGLEALTLVAGLAIGIFGHNWSAAIAIISGGALGSGTLSSIGLMKSQDAPKP